MSSRPQLARRVLWLIASLAWLAILLKVVDDFILPSVQAGEATPVMFVRYAKDFNLLTEFVPNTSATLHDIKFAINRWGFRDDDWSERPEQGQQRIAVLGDSVSYPFGLDHEKGWEYQLEQELNSHDIKSVLLNFAVPAYNCSQQDLLLKRTIKKFQAYKVIWQLSGNDDEVTGAGSMLPWIDHPKSGFSWLPFNLVKSLIMQYYARQFEKQRSADQCLRLARSIIGEFPAERRILLLLPMRHHEEQVLFDKVLASPEAASFKVIDLREVLRKSFKSENELFIKLGDNIHLSFAAHQIIARELFLRLLNFD